MAEENKAVELNDEALDAVAGGNSGNLPIWYVECPTCNSVLGSGLIFDAAKELADKHYFTHRKKEHLCSVKS